MGSVPFYTEFSWGSAPLNDVWVPAVGGGVYALVMVLWASRIRASSAVVSAG